MEWNETGIKDTAKWEKEGFTPEDAFAWKDAGFRFKDANVWVREDYTLEEAKPWNDAEFSAEKAFEWIDEGIEELEDVLEWEEEGFDFGDASMYHERGLSPKQAREEEEKKDWTKAGIQSADVAKWRAAKFKLADAKKWRAAGFKLKGAKLWREKFTPADAELWKKADFGIKEAKAWKAADFTLGGAKAWKNDYKITLADAKPWKAAGFDDAAQVKRWMAAGFDKKDAAEAKAWIDAKFTPEVAKIWRGAGFKSKPKEARKWYKLSEGNLDVAKTAFDDNEMTIQEAKKWVSEGWSLKSAAKWYGAGWKDKSKEDIINALELKAKHKKITPQDALNKLNSAESTETEDIPEWAQIDEKNQSLTISEGLSKRILTRKEMLKLPQKSCNSIDITPEAKIHTIAKVAFKDATTLKTFRSAGVNSIESEAFSGCTGLEKCVIKTSLSISLGSKAFNNCKNIKELTLFSSSDKVIYLPKKSPFTGAKIEKIFIKKGTRFFVDGKEIKGGAMFGATGEESNIRFKNYIQKTTGKKPIIIPQ